MKTKTLIPRLILAAMLTLTGALAACGDSNEAGENLIDAEAVDAREHNSVELDGILYRVVMFRQLNPRIPPDRALYQGPLPNGDAGIFAAFIRACNTSDDRRLPTKRIHLETAFGERYRPLESATEPSLAYEPPALAPDDCIPASDGVADRAFPGAAILFRVPFEQLGNRPFVLELRDRDARGESAVRRIELDV